MLAKHICTMGDIAGRVLTTFCRCIFSCNSVVPTDLEVMNIVLAIYGPVVEQDSSLPFLMPFVPLVKLEFTCF